MNPPGYPAAVQASVKDMRRLRLRTAWHLLLRGRLPVEGFSSATQLLYLAHVACRSGVRLVGEIGFNAGFSAHAFLAANPDVHVVSFDLNEHGVVKAAKKLIDRRYPGRHTLILGDSRDTVPAFAADNPDLRFDAVFIDGGHQYEVAKADIANMKPLSTRETVVVMDDVTPWRKWGVGPHRAWTEALEQGVARQDALYQDGKPVEAATPTGRRCWAAGGYVFDV